MRNFRRSLGEEFQTITDNGHRCSAAVGGELRDRWCVPCDTADAARQLTSHCTAERAACLRWTTRSGSFDCDTYVDSTRALSDLWRQMRSIALPFDAGSRQGVWRRSRDLKGFHMAPYRSMLRQRTPMMTT